jgi:3alpha(or 20beta)-hydroxysteroid dehydrogenase
MSGRLDGKVAIITGSASGMGKSHIEMFAKEGAKVIATDINSKDLKEIVDKINKEYPNSTIACKLDVSSGEDWDTVISKGLKDFGLINVLINNAGIGFFSSLEELTYEEWKKEMDVDLWGVMLGMKKILPHMKSKGGSIINVSSIAALNASEGATTYTSSKGGVTAFSRGAALEFAKYNIRVNSVHPGSIKTEMFINGFKTKEMQNKFEQARPLKRVGRTKEVSNLMIFLASDESSFITGTSQVIDGGSSVEATEIAPGILSRIK